MSDNKPPKPNGTGIDPMQRLTSLKPSRDLTLGAAKPTKKVFLPNLNVARNKKGPSTSNQAAKKDDRNRRDRSNDKNKNFRGPNVIKSTGVFSEGLGQAERHSSRASFGREADAKPSMQKPTIRVRDFVKIDKELEDQKIRSVLGEGSDLNGGSGYVDGPSVDFKKTSEKDAPIKLPMDDGCWTEPIPPVKVKQEVIVKTEPDELEHFVGDKKPVAAIKQEHCEETEVVKLLKKSEPTLILLQLPDTLPGRGGARETDAPRRKGQEEPSTSAAQDTPVDNRCYLSELEEGRIGTIRTHRSGRVTLLLGDTVFEVNMGTKPAFHQEVVSMACDEASRSAALVSLGALQHKLSIVPHWETMFKEINK